MTQTVFGRPTVLACSEFWGRLATRAVPRRASLRPRPGCQTSGVPVRGPPTLCRPRCGLQTFPAPAPTLTQSFPVGASWARSRVSARSCPNSAPRATRTAEGAPVWLRSSHRGNPGARSRGRSLGKPRTRARRGTIGEAPWPYSFPRRYLLACGGVSGRLASPGAVSPRSCPCWLFSRAPCTGGGGLVCCSAILPGRRRPGSTAPASRHRALPDLPPGARSARAPASTQTLRARGEREVADSLAQSQVAGPGGPATVPGRRPAPLEGRREGAGTAAATPCSLGAPSWGQPPGACHSPA